MGACFLRVEWRIGGDRHYFFPSSAVGGQFFEFIDALYSLYCEGIDNHNWHCSEVKCELKTTKTEERGFEITHVISRFCWDEEGRLIEISLCRSIDYWNEAKPGIPDPITVKINVHGKAAQEYEYSIDGVDLCYAVAKACTEAMKKYGLYGYFFSTFDGCRFGDFFDIGKLLFIKAYALNALDVRTITEVWRKPGSWRSADRTDFNKEIELLLFDM